MSDPAPTVIVTGASSGIGFETARQLVRSGHQLVLACRNQERAKALYPRFGPIPDWQVSFLPLDLESLPSIRKFVKLFEQKFEGWDILIHNAGVVYPDRRLTGHGVEAQLQVIYLGPFLLTELLRPRMRPSARVINVASDLHRRARLHDPKELESTDYQFIRNYARAEFAKIVWTYELSRRLGPGQVAHCLHPGGIRTNLFRHLSGPTGWLFRLSNLLKRGPAAGARTPVFLASDPAALACTGKYWIANRQVKSAPGTYDREFAQKLWYWSSRQVADH